MFLLPNFYEALMTGEAEWLLHIHGGSIFRTQEQQIVIVIIQDRENHSSFCCFWGEWVTESLSQSVVVAEWVLIPIEDLTDVTLEIGDTEDDEDEEDEGVDEEDEEDE